MDSLNSLQSIHHSGSSRYVSPSQPHLGEPVMIRLRASVDAPIQEILLRTCPDGEQHFTRMQPEDHTEARSCRWWTGTIPIHMPQTSYRFLILCRNASYWYNGSGLHSYNPTDAEDFRILADYEAPVWVNNAVFYQVFPDRFADGDPANNVVDGEYEYAGFPARTRKWGEPPTQGSRAAMVEFYGGDIQGVINHLDYLADLGITALYLNPVFTSLSNHRYDVIDYFSVDPHLGGNTSLVELRQALNDRGMRYILDIVPNHCGLLHPWFQEAQADPQAPTAGYFTFRKHPDEYESWLGVRTLVKLNYRSAELREVMYAGPGSVFRYWLQEPYSADGWRIDVANMLARQGADQLGEEVGRGIRQAVKQENPRAYLIGENFFDATNQLQGDCWDGVMNYSGFTLPLGNWLWNSPLRVPGQSQPITPGSRLTTEALVASWAVYRASIPWAIACQQFNLIGSHDTPRALALLQGNRELFKLAATIMFTYPGVPCIYYGDEIGLGGGQELNPRQCMNWDLSTWDADLLGWYKLLIQLKKTSTALSDGGFQVLLTEPDTLVYQRDTDEEIILVAAHRGEAARPSSLLPVEQGAIPDGMVFEELFTHQRVTVIDGCFFLPDISQGVQLWVGRNP